MARKWIFDWTGEVGPLAVQCKTTLSEASWVNTSFTAARTGGTALGGASGFFRFTKPIISHTPSNGGGEMHAELLPPGTAIPLRSIMSGASENPAVTTSGSGSATFSLEGSRLTFNVSHRDPSGKAILGPRYHVVSTQSQTVQGKIRGPIGR